MDFSPKRFNVVVADDSPLERKLVEDTPAEGPYRKKRPRGADAPRRFYRPAVLITGWEMPDLTGI